MHHDTDRHKIHQRRRVSSDYIQAGQRSFSLTKRHHIFTGAMVMAKGEQKGNREAKKPKKEKPKTVAAAPSQKGSPPVKTK